MRERPTTRRYEIMVLRDKRWLIDCIAPREADARARAEELLGDDSVLAVRVLRGRFGEDGTAFETVVFERTCAPRRGAAPIRIAAAGHDIAWCESIDDLYGPASRGVIARLLRNFLDRFGITPTELLHHHRYIKLLERQDALMGQALQRAAAQQARARGIDLKERVDALDRIVNQAADRARDALASRAAPRLGEGGLNALAADVASGAFGPSEQSFYIRFAVSRAFEDLGALAAKLEAVVAWHAQDAAPSLMPLIDELAAGLLGAAALVQEVIGPQPHMAAALDLLIDLARGRAVIADTRTPWRAALAGLMAGPSMVETRDVLMERVRRELASEKPLSRDDRMIQRRLFTAVLDKLIDQNGLFFGGTAMIEAIARRSRRFEIVGGIEAVRFRATDPAARLDELVTIASGVLGERQQRAIATYMADTLEQIDAPCAQVHAIKEKLGTLVMPDLCRRTLIERITEIERSPVPLQNAG